MRATLAMDMMGPLFESQPAGPHPSRGKRGAPVQPLRVLDVGERLRADLTDAQAETLDEFRDADFRRDCLAVVGTDREASHGLQHLPAGAEDQALEMVSPLPGGNPAPPKKIQ